MGMTFNRQPLSMATPSQNDVKNYYFNHMSWKGVNTDRNVLAIDQETFQDSNNIYIDDEGLLRSRPGMKLKNVGYTNITDIYVFGDVMVYETTKDNIKTLYFVNKKFNSVVRKDLITDMDYKLVLADNKIFIFENGNFSYYDIDTNECVSALDNVYIPITNVFVNGVLSDTKLEQNNILTNAYKNRYLIDSSKVEPNYGMFYGKTVDISIDGIDKKGVFFKENSELGLISNKFTVPDNAISKANTFSERDKDITMLDFSDTGSIVMTTVDGEGKLADIFYSTQNIQFIKLPRIDGMLAPAKISKDGTIAIAFLRDGPYVYSLIATGVDAANNPIKKYPVWTNIIQKLNPSEYMRFNIVNTRTWTGYFLTDSQFVVGYCDTTPSAITTYYAITCFDNKFTKSTVYIPESGYSFSRLLPICKLYVDTSTEVLTYKFVIVLEVTYFTLDKQLVLYIGPENRTQIISNVTVRSLLKTADLYIDKDEVILGYFSPHLNILTLTDDTFTDIVLKLPGDSATPGCKISQKTKYMAICTGIITVTDYINPSESYYEDNMVPWIPDTVQAVPLYYNDIAYVNLDGVVKSNKDLQLTIDVIIDGSINYFVPQVFSELANFYFSKGSKLYITNNRTEKEIYKWYIPENSYQTFGYEITNMHPISDTTMAIFFETEIWYSLYDTDINNYRFYKSKLQSGCKKGSDVTTTYDGKYTIFVSNRGLVAMSYQDFIASNEQVLTYLSDTVYDIFTAYTHEDKSKNNIKLFKTGNWLVVYKQDSLKYFVFDFRNSSWWPMSSLHEFTKLVDDKNIVTCLAKQNLYSFDTNDTLYFDKDSKGKYNIEWHIKSQKLHLKAINNYKHITSITFISIHDIKNLESNINNVNNLNFRLQTNIYRKQTNGNIGNKNDYEVINYNVNTIRTFVQRLNFSKVNEFEYLLSSDKDTVIQIPLSLNSINIKYRVGGQVR